MDMTKLGVECSEMMEALSLDFPDDAEIGVVGLVAEITLADDTTYVATFCSDRRRWVQVGFFREAALAADAAVADAGEADGVGE